VYPDLTVAENLAFRAAAYGLAGPAAREQAQEYLDRAGLAAARDRLGGELSGGMRQKLGMIMAMVHRPQLLVLDEPTTGVDPVSRSDLWWLIARAAAGGAAVVLATTYLDEAERSAAVLALDGGRELAQGTPEEIIAALPGTLRAVDARPDGQDSRRAWRRGGQWRVWDPPAADHPASSPDLAGSRIRASHPAGSPDLAGSRIRAGHPASSPDLAGSRIRASRPPAGQLDGVIQPDLQDAVTIAALARELQAAGRTT
jgi:ABC-2 type transport system ATP-binding protein